MTNKSAAAPILPPGQSLQSQVRNLFHESFMWFQHHWLEILISGGIAAAIVLLLHGIRAWAIRLCSRGDGTASWTAIIGRALAKTGNFFIIMAALQLVSGYADPPQTVSTTIRVLFTVAAFFQCAIWVRELIFGAIEHRTTSETYHNEGLASALGIIRLLVSIALFAVATVMVLSNVGVNVTGLVAGLGIGGIAIGLAAQGIFGDLIAALSIIFDRPFRVGQNIKYDTTSGTIEQIGLKSTRIRSFDGELRIISNRQLLDKEIQNLSDRNHIRFAWMLGVAYETPPETLDRIPGILKEVVEAEGAKAPRAGFANFSASTLDYELIVEVPSSDWSVAHPTRDRIATAILRRFAAEKINLPYPTQTTYTAAPDGTLVMPYPDPQTVRVDGD
ncbi:mechanosensitive ion channel family protein [Sphingomonas sp. S2-65]|uniref:mechanosensitive ion channel family protein n=1 Tax=Sphingomonas sp. S2-65 TaxID=2903960 RepID=UPI001F4684EF|nr:mechanosensitive ion channel domain-containing protein [Sphingomonas sp. S2-65]UYY59809.1 mechanosensitive ion channel family protein [Sphingomonas sp. S2-65]